MQAICESVLIIAHGRLVAFDTPQNLEKAIAPNRLELCADAQEAELRAILAQVPAVAGVEAQPWQNGCRAVLTLDTAALHEEEKVQLMGFGSFEVKKRAARTGRNPRSKETIEIPASQTPVFKAGKALKDAVAK